MRELVFMLSASIGFSAGILLRYIPFAKLVTPKQKKILLTAYISALLISDVYLYYKAVNGEFTIAFAKVNMILFGLITTFINILVIRGRIREHLFTYGLVTTYNYMLLTVVTYAVYITRGFDGIDDYIMEMSGFGVLFALFYPLARRLMLRTITPFLTINSGNYWNTIWFVPIAMYYACVLALPSNQHVSTLMHVISRAFINFATIFICHSVAGDYELMQEKLELNEQLGMQKEHYAQLSGKILEARKARHDFKHHMAAVYHYIETDDRTGLKEYCDRLLLQNGEEISIPYTGNAAADGVLYRYMQLAWTNQVHLEMNGVIRSNGIMDVDLCALLGNALENAMSGCLTVQQNRFISVIAESTEQILTIVIQNSFDGVVQNKGDGRILSRKRENEAGIGLSSMRSICEKYEGGMEIQYDDSTFTVLIMLPLRMESETPAGRIQY